MNETYGEIISGRGRGMGAAAVRAGLSLLAAGYRCGVWGRNRAFDCGLKRTRRVAVPVVSIGNLTAGGTGKTPLVAYVADWFQQRGVKPALLSRGYRALPDQVNDEKLVLDQLCPGVPHYQQPDRVTSAEKAIAAGAQVLILDDGFQHRRLGRDLDIVLIDATRPWGYGRLLPRGLLREPSTALRRADLVVITRANHVSERELEELRQQIAAVRGDNTCVETSFPPRMLRNWSGKTVEFSALADQRWFAFCGIGNPAGFRATLDQLQFPIAEFRVFPDHHHYTEGELAELGSAADRADAAGLVTTLKDLVKIRRDELAGHPVWAVEIATEIRVGAEILNERLESVLRRIN